MHEYIIFKNENVQMQESLVVELYACILLEFTVEALTCFDSYNQPRLGGGRLFEHAAIEPWKRPPKPISTLLPCSCINN